MYFEKFMPAFIEPRLAVARLEAFLAYFTGPEDYLHTQFRTDVTFEDIVDFMTKYYNVSCDYYNVSCDSNVT